MGTMFLLFNFGVVSLITFLCIHRVSSCEQSCADKPVFTPSRLVVKYGDPASATCVVCKDECHGKFFGLEIPLGNKKENGTTLLWMIDKMTEWDTEPMCFYNTESDDQCCSILPVTVYQPPENVSLSFVNHTGPISECGQYTLQCAVHNVAPVQSLLVTFYRGQTVLGQLPSSIQPQKKPATELFALNINISKADDGAQYWCEAKLELGAEGPQPSPVVTGNITATVNCLEFTSTRLPSTTTPTKTSTSSETAPTMMMTATTKTAPNNGADSAFIWRFLVCLGLLLSALV